MQLWYSWRTGTRVTSYRHAHESDGNDDDERERCVAHRNTCLRDSCGHPRVLTHASTTVLLSDQYDKMTLSLDYIVSKHWTKCWRRWTCGQKRFHFWHMVHRLMDSKGLLNVCGSNTEVVPSQSELRWRQTFTSDNDVMSRRFPEFEQAAILNLIFCSLYLDTPILLLLNWCPR